MIMRPRRAVASALVGGWLLLPVMSYQIAGFPDYTKVTATSLGLLLGISLFDPGRLPRFRIKWVDVPILVFCLSPMASSLSNGLGPYDGLSAVAAQVGSWGIPYFVGRLYFDSQEALLDLAVAMFIGGALCIPLCLWEVRMAPNLHSLVYGYRPSRFVHLARYGGYRPLLFMQSPLMVGMWMSAISLMMFWLWSSGSLRRLIGIPILYLLVPAVIVLVLCKAIGAIAIFLVGVGLFFATKCLARPWPLIALLVAVACYAPLRISGVMGTETLVAAGTAVFDIQRTHSLRIRLENEDQLSEKAMERPILGWGRWGRNRVSSETGKDVSLTDGLWIIVFGTSGWVGLMALVGIQLLPGYLLISRWSASTWVEPRSAVVATFSVLLSLWAVDNLMNAFVNPIYICAMGGVCSLPGRRPIVRRKERRASVLSPSGHGRSGRDGVTWNTRAISMDTR